MHGVTQEQLHEINGNKNNTFPAAVALSSLANEVSLARREPFMKALYSGN
jgi:hypothetical protein